MDGARWIGLLSAVLAVGCGAGDLERVLLNEGSAGAAPALQDMCDGSDQVRFIHSVNGGINSFDRGPYSRFDARFMAIDGRCNYWLGGDGSIGGIVGGTLGAERARRLSGELHFGQYSSVAAYRERAICLDASTLLLSDGTGVLQLRCSTDEAGAPRIWTEALQRSSSLFGELQREGTRQWRPSRILVRQTEPDARRTAADWTSDLDLASNAVDFDYTNGEIDGDPFSVLVEDEPTLDLLDRLRGAELAATQFAADLYVRDARGDYYVIAVQDVLPPHVESAVLGLLAE